MLFPGYVTPQLTTAFLDKIRPLLTGTVTACGLPRFSMQQNEKTKGATRYVEEVIDLYADLAAFRGISEHEIRTEGVDVWVADLAPDPSCVITDEHVGYVVRRGDALLAMIDSSGVKLRLNLPVFGKANAANQLMIQLIEAVRHTHPDGAAPRMLMPAADDRAGRNRHQTQALEKYAIEQGIEWYQNGQLLDWTDFGTTLAKAVNSSLNQRAVDDKKLGAIRAAIRKLEAGENGQLAEQKLPFPMRYQRDRRKPAKGPNNGVIVESRDDQAAIATVQTLVRGLANGDTWTAIGNAIAAVNPRLPMTDPDTDAPRHFRDTDDYAAAARALVVTKSKGRPRTFDYLYANLEMWRSGRWKTIRRVGDSLQGWREVELPGHGTYPIVTPAHGERYIEIEARFDRWPPDPDTGEPLVSYGLTDTEFDAAAAELRRRHQVGRGRAQTGPAADRARMKLVGPISPQPEDEASELRTYHHGAGRYAALIVARGTPGTNRSAASRIARIPLPIITRTLATTAENAVADLIGSAATFTSPTASERDAVVRRATERVERLQRQVERTQTELQTAVDSAATASNDITRDAFLQAADRAGETIEQLGTDLERATAERDQLERDQQVQYTDHLHLADLIAIGHKSTDGHAPTALARMFTNLFDWTTWRWDHPDSTAGLVEATVDLVVPLTDGSDRRIPLRLALRPSRGNQIDPADRVQAILLHGVTIEQLADIEQITRGSLVASTHRWLRRRGCHIPAAALSNRHPETRRAVWQLATGDDVDVEPRHLERVRDRYFTIRPFDGRTWTTWGPDGRPVAEPYDHTLAQRAVDFLLELDDPDDGLPLNDLAGELGCCREDLGRKVLGWNGGPNHLPHPAYLARTANDTLTPHRCSNPTCGKWASVVRLTPITWPTGLVCPDCGWMLGCDGPLPDSYRE